MTDKPIYRAIEASREMSERDLAVLAKVAGKTHPPSQPDASDDAWEQVGFWKEKARQADANLKELNEKYLPRYAAAVAANRAQPDASALVEAIVEAALDVANVVSYDGYYEIDRDAAVRAALSAWEASNG